MVARRPSPSAQETAESVIEAEFELTDHTGRAVSNEDFRGKWLLVFFGFTHCPDVCPTTLAAVSEVMARLGPAAEAVQPLFVTVDPERDTPKVMREYMTAFRPGIVGLTGTPEQLAAAARSFRIYYAKVDLPNSPGGYTMDHSAFLYLMNPDGGFATHFAPNNAPEKTADAVRKRVEAS